EKMWEITDDTYQDTSKVGLWSKADAQTHFDEFKLASCKVIDYEVLMNLMSMLYSFRPDPGEQSPVACSRPRPLVVPSPRSMSCAGFPAAPPDRLRRWRSVSGTPIHPHGPAAAAAPGDCTPAGRGAYAGSGPRRPAADSLPCPIAACRPDERSPCPS